LLKHTAPASRKRAAGGASCVAGTSWVAALPSGVGTPCVAMFSFSVSGTPSSGPSGVPASQRASEALACANAVSASSS